jgi:uncharacterized protein (TIGR04255 family)
MSDHPHYPNDTIQEALCEFRLKPSSRTEWTPKRPGEIMRQLGPNNFPGMEPITEIGIELNFDASGQPQQRIIQGPAKIRFSNDDGTLLVQVSPVLYSFNAVRQYPGWDGMQNLLIDNWKKIMAILAPECIERIGLRYINKIPLTQDHPNISDWLKQSRYIPEAIKDSMLGSKYRFESRISENDIIIVIIVDQKDETGANSLFFDIDRGVTMKNLPDEATLRSEIKRLHDDVWEAFRDAKTPLYDTYLNREKNK